MSKQFTSYVKAAIPDRYIIFGVTLRPLSLGHIVLMKRLGCGFAEDEEETKISIMDLLIAVAICCRRYQEFIDWYNDDEARTKWLKKWFNAINKEANKSNSYSIINKMSLFNMYRREGIDIPAFIDENEDKESVKESGAHWIQNVITTLVTENRYNDVEIYDIPVSKALSEYFKILENKGCITFMPDWQIESLKNQAEAAKETVTNGQ
jgi:hypothetical protein